HAQAVGLGALVAVGAHADDVLAGARGAGFDAARLRAYDDAAALARAINTGDLDLGRDGDTILVKGSRSVGMERAADALRAALGAGEDDG
ncbi:MAG: UDP-N-acetylmuramoyl-tripeptide--D-alanyl-D-alanine ligase, partial [Acidobacteriota bacterium]